MTEIEYPTLGEYIVCFVDVLGQRAALKALPHRAPRTEDPAALEDFVDKVYSAVGKVGTLHNHTQFLLDTFDSSMSKLTEHPNPQTQQILEAARQHDLRQQRWSDGVMVFSPMWQGYPSSKMTIVVGLLCLAGLNTLAGLAGGYAIRGGIEMGWASELRANELYGVAVANAYELESEIAQYPRIVVGEQLVQSLDEVATLLNPDSEAAGEQAVAKMALSLIKRDVDGVHIVDYLGPGFRSCGITSSHELVVKALEFVRSQLAFFQRERNTKLAFRYHLLLSYFLANRE